MGILRAVPYLSSGTGSRDSTTRAKFPNEMLSEVRVCGCHIRLYPGIVNRLVHPRKQIQSVIRVFRLRLRFLKSIIYRPKRVPIIYLTCTALDTYLRSALRARQTHAIAKCPSSPRAYSTVAIQVNVCACAASCIQSS